MITTETKYQVKCDGCGNIFHFGNRIFFKNETIANKRVSEDIEWHTPNDKPLEHYCNYCWSFDAHGKVIIKPHAKV